MSGERILPSEACLHVNDLILMRITVKYESVIKGSWDEKKTLQFLDLAIFAAIFSWLDH